jgi:hypothetical protein
MICPHCKVENPHGDSYCGKCGHGLTEEVARLPRYTDRRLLVRRELAILLGGIFLIIVAACGAWYVVGYQRSPAMVVRKFIDADIAGQFAQQQQYVANSWDSRAALSLYQQIRQQAGASPFKNSVIKDVSVDRGQTAFINVEITVTPPKLPVMPGGFAPPPALTTPTVFPFTFVMQRENGEWKIDSTQTLVSAAMAVAFTATQKLGPNFAFPNMKLPPGFPNLAPAPNGIVIPNPSGPGSTLAPQAQGSGDGSGAI